MTSPSTALKTAVYTKLSQRSSLITLLGGTLIYDRVAPSEVDEDPGFVVFQVILGRDENLDSNRSRDVYVMAKGVADSASKAGAIDDEIDGCFADASLTITGWGLYWLDRSRDVEYTESVEGARLIYHTGAMYRFRIDKH